MVFVRFMQMMWEAGQFPMMRGVVPTANQSTVGVLPMEAVFLGGRNTIAHANPFDALQERTIDEMDAQPVLRDAETRFRILGRHTKRQVPGDGMRDHALQPVLGIRHRAYSNPASFSSRLAARVA